MPVAEAPVQAHLEAAPDAGAVIAATKLHIPVLREGLVPRTALVEALVDGASRKLTLLAAPPGSGKTTLLSEWLASPSEERPFAWLSVDAGDNDPVRFWAGVIEALRTVEPGVGGAALATLGTRSVDLADVALPLLINDLAPLDRRLVLVLDDYHRISERRVHESLAFLLDHLPPVLHLALATRADPPLPLSRYRARAELTEIRAADLRFSHEEAATLLNDALGLEIHPADVARLQRRTEGWVAGLYLAALSLRGRTEVREFIASFAGDDRQIADYLSTEVLAGQPEEVRDFLLQTSILERMCGPLCDAVTGAADSAGTLERLERSNLFVVSLDRNRVWYRYHQLFGDLLRRELEVSRSASVVELHQAACRWFREQGLPADAIHHAVAAGDTHEARGLVARHWREPFNQGRLETVASWLQAIPGAREDPRLCIAGAWVSMDQGHLEEAARWIAAAEAGVASPGEGDGRTSVAADAAVLRAVHTFKVGDVEAGLEAARRVLELVPEGASFPRVVAHCILGVTLYWRGDAPQEAVLALEEASRLAEVSGNDLGRGYALGYLALLRADRGQLDDAERLGRTATEGSDDPGFAEHFVPMIGFLALGKVAEQRGRLDAAERAISRAVELSGRGAGRLEAAYARLALAKVRHALGEREDAKRLIGEARKVVDGSAHPGTLTAAIAAAERGVRVGPRRHGPGVAASDELTDRELAVLRLLKSDLSRREIGNALYVSQNTVKTHIRGIYRKLDAVSREQAIARARELGLL